MPMSKSARGIAWLAMLAACAVATAADLRPFTVQDSIRLGRIEGFSISPDGTKAAVITRRGNLEAGANDCELLIYQASEIVAFVDGRRSAPPAPTTAARLSSDSNYPAIRNLRWLDDGMRIAFLGEARGELPQIYVTDTRSGQLQKVTEHPQRIAHFTAAAQHFAWVSAQPPDPAQAAPASGYFITTESIWELIDPDRDFGEPAQNALMETFVAAPPARSRRIAGPATRKYLRGISRDLQGTWLSPDGRYVVELRVPGSLPPAWRGYRKPSADNFRMDEQPLFALSPFTLVDIDTGNARPLIDAPNGSQFNRSVLDVAWMPGGRSVVLSNVFLPLDPDTAADDPKRDAPYVVEVDIESGALAPIARLAPEDVAARVSRMSVDSTSGEITLSGIAPASAQQLSPSYWTLRYRKTDGRWREVSRKVASYPQAELLGLRVSLSMTSGLNEPPGLIATDVRTRRSALVTDLNPELRDLQLSEAKPYRWTDAAGRQWTGALLLPPDFRTGQRYPLIIQTHGYAPGTYFVDGLPTAFAARALAAKGFVVLQVEDKETLMGTEEEASGHVEGYRGAIQSLDQGRMIDPRRVGLVGFSRTCYHVKSAVVTDGIDIAAAVVADGVDFGYMQFLLAAPNNDFGAGYQSLTARLFGADAATPFGTQLQEFAKRSPPMNADRVTAPLLIQALNVRSLLSEWGMYSSLKTLGKPVELLLMADGAHSLVRPRERFTSMRATVDWFDFWLQGREDPDPAKAGQYARWRKMRDAQVAGPAGKPLDIH